MNVVFLQHEGKLLLLLLNDLVIFVDIENRVKFVKKSRNVFNHFSSFFFSSCIKRD